ncbi:hypothetical protein MIND_00239500 [Mycena indigotica]|uniref:Glycosyltransferase 61 catalytic domain-containing protein n=1 Tax=Mycena indigotica TaxID=2126181 RepID=A0A8H6TAE1_9AGAR|nr:uncharacterized protein MIND_00239500 [Mycena indigotica]KAF7312265.1 hypothetical protein MIND_00239500 [Mycena indigotica]
MGYKISRREVVFALLGGCCFYLFTSLATDSRRTSLPLRFNDTHFPATTGGYLTSQPAPLDLGLSYSLPQTEIIAHAPGWTLFRDLYMSKGALVLLTNSSPSFPDIALMTSTGLPGNLTNDAERMPTERDMAFVTPQEARARWGGKLSRGERNRILTLEGTTLLYNDPPQFLNHYFHFVAELMFGTWALLFGAFDRTISPPSTIPAASFTPPLLSTNTPTITRAIFIHSDGSGWRDGPGFNGYAMRAVFPSATVETSIDWVDRINATKTEMGRAWHFPLALLVDRSAAFRNPMTGAHTQRTAAQAWMVMAKQGKIDLIGNWWASIRAALTRYAGGDSNESLDSELQMPDHVVITYINRQGTRRHLRGADNLALVSAIQDLVDRKNRQGKKWEFQDVHAERLSLDEQIRVTSRTTIMLGVHGNGLTHLVLMKPNRLSAVIEIFIPGGFARDYEWTSRSLGMSHYSVWNDTTFTYPHEPPDPAYPDGFHGPSIPLHAPTVIKLIEDHVAARENGPTRPNNSPVDDFYADDI